MSETRTSAYHSGRIRLPPGREYAGPRRRDRTAAAPALGRPAPARGVPQPNHPQRRQPGLRRPAAGTQIQRVASLWRLETGHHRCRHRTRSAAAYRVLIDQQCPGPSRSVTLERHQKGLGRTRVRLPEPGHGVLPHRDSADRTWGSAPAVRRKRSRRAGRPVLRARRQGRTARPGHRGEGLTEASDPTVGRQLWGAGEELTRTSYL